MLGVLGMGLVWGGWLGIVAHGAARRRGSGILPVAFTLLAVGEVLAFAGASGTAVFVTGVLAALLMRSVARGALRRRYGPQV